MRPLVVVPAFNETGAIGKVIEGIRATDPHLSIRGVVGGPDAARRIGMRVFRLFAFALTRVRCTDVTSGFQALNRRALGFVVSYRVHGDAVPRYYLVDLAVHAGHRLLVHRLATLAFGTPVLSGSDSWSKVAAWRLANPGQGYLTIEKTWTLLLPWSAINISSFSFKQICDG